MAMEAVAEGEQLMRRIHNAVEDGEYQYAREGLQAAESLVQATERFLRVMPASRYLGPPRRPGRPKKGAPDS